MSSMSHLILVLLLPVVSVTNEIICNSLVNTPSPLQTEFVLRTYTFEEIVDKETTMEFFGVTNVRWYDPCPWEMVSAGMANRTNVVQWLPFDSSKIWKPTFIIKNAASRDISILDSEQSYPAIATFDGYVELEVPLFFKVKCTSMKHGRFPFDIQPCTVRIESWIADNFVNISSVKFYQSSALPWTLPDSVWIEESRSFNFGERFCWFYGNSEACCTPIMFNFIMKRQWLGYVFSIYLPLVTLTLLQLATFAFVPECHERPIYSVTLLLAFEILRQTISENFPDSSDIIYTVFLADGCMAISVAVSIYTTVTVAFAKKVSRKIDLVFLILFIIAYLILYVAIVCLIFK